MKFDAADVDGDEALSLEEYAAFLYPYDFKHMHDVEIDVTLKEMDADKDGSINFKEFLGEGQCNDAKCSKLLRASLSGASGFKSQLGLLVFFGPSHLQASSM